mmetsp:Transcript_18836/g.45360  ORF Transcript_18836/g.45360 Transcript_18836/m.45360 type:complete len:88 (-) Transcript_18836:1696-1959(-)
MGAIDCWEVIKTGSRPRLGNAGEPMMLARAAERGMRAERGFGWVRDDERGGVCAAPGAEDMMVTCLWRVLEKGGCVTPCSFCSCQYL